MAATPAIPGFPRQVLWLTLFAACLSALDMPYLAVMLFPAPVAVHWVRGDRGPGVVLAALSGLVLLAVTRSLPWAFIALVVAAFGALLGMLIRKGLTFGQCVTVLTFVGTVFTGIYLTVNGPAVHKLCTIWMAARVKEFEAAGDAESPMQGMAQWFHWLGENLLNLGFGLAFGLVLVVAVLLVVAVSRRLAPEGKQPPGRFGEMRTPEWVVWPVIATALLFMADQQWHYPAMRVVSWNMAQALEWVYGLNGLSIVIYAVGVLVKGSARYQAMLVVLVFMLFSRAITFFGLFDTWLDFRRKADRWAEARRAGQSDRDGES